MNKRELIDKIKVLDLPSDSYIVIGSGLLGALELRKVRDIDLVVSPDIVERFKKDQRFTKHVERDTTFYRWGIYDIATTLKRGSYTKTFQQVRESAKMIEGVPFLNIDETIAFKKALGRKKDKEDIILLEKYKERVSM